jgi:hypothetical protein
MTRRYLWNSGTWTRGGLQGGDELDADHHFSVLTDLLEATIVVSFPSGAASHVLTGMRPRLNRK